MAVLALIPAGLFLSGWYAWHDSVLIATIALITLIAALSPIALKNEIVFTAEAGLGLAAVVLVGPLPALLIAVGVEASASLLDRRPALSFLSNVAAAGWDVVAASVFLYELAGGWPVDLANPISYVAIGLAGCAMFATNFFLGVLLAHVLPSGESFASATAERFTPLVFGLLLQIALVAAAAALFPVIGIPALVLFVAIVMVPQHVLLPKLVAEHERLKTAEPQYRLKGFDLHDRLSAISVQLSRIQNLGQHVEKLLCLGSEVFREYRVEFPPEGREAMSEFQQRQAARSMIRLMSSLTPDTYKLMIADDRDILARPHVFKDHGQLAKKKPGSVDSDYEAKVRREKTRPARSLVPYRLADDPNGECFHGVKRMLETCCECEDGGGFPAQLDGSWRDSPYAATFQVAFAIAGWQVQGLTDEQIVLELRDRAGTQFDPEAVSAAAQLVAQEKAALEGEGSFKPRLHTVPVPSVALRIISPILGLDRAA